MQFPLDTARRVAASTPSDINRKIAIETLLSIRRANVGGVDAINARLAELDREWDVERCLQTTASSAILLGLTLGATGNRRWHLLPLGVAGFLLQHALQGWCPPLPVLRRLGIRTAQEIDEERYALKALRGDFAQLGSLDESQAANAAFKSVRH